MFASIAGRYDLANRVLSGGVDRRWRRRVVRRAAEVEGVERTGDGGPLQGLRALDIACGTGDLAQELDRAGAAVVGVDFTFEMLALAPPKVRPGIWVQGDGTGLPVASGAFDIATIAFGLRNVVDRRAALREMRRVLRPGGRALVLEFSMPKQNLFGRAYKGYLMHVLPRIGGALSGDRAAYAYLDDTVRGWPDPERLRDEMAEDGFLDCRFERLWQGIACLHMGTAPE